MAIKGIKGIVSYDAMETIRNTNEWMGASARAIASYPIFALNPHPIFKLMSAWGRVTERSYARMVIKPDWEIPPIAGDQGQDHIVYVEPVMKRPFGDLIHFRVARRAAQPAAAGPGPPGDDRSVIFGPSRQKTCGRRGFAGLPGRARA